MDLRSQHEGQQMYLQTRREKRLQDVRVRLTDSEALALRLQCQVSGLSRSEFLRRAISVALKQKCVIGRRDETLR
jgi:hypothetical protein